jgi:hypothetical protein
MAIHEMKAFQRSCKPLQSFTLLDRIFTLRGHADVVMAFLCRGLCIRPTHSFTEDLRLRFARLRVLRSRRQRFPGGVPQQVTSGPVREDGISLSPDGNDSHAHARPRGDCGHFIQWQHREATASGRSDGVTNFIPPGSFSNAELQESTESRSRATSRRMCRLGTSPCVRIFCIDRIARNGSAHAAEGGSDDPMRLG